MLEQCHLFAMQYDMSITNETQHQPEPEPIPGAAPSRPTTVTQRRPSQFDQGSHNYNGVSSGQYGGASVGAGQYAGSGQYAGAGVGSGQYSGSGQFNAVSQPAYSGSPRFSSTPVDWTSSTTSATPAAGTTYNPTDTFSSQQSGKCRYKQRECTVVQFGTGLDRCTRQALWSCFVNLCRFCVPVITCIAVLLAVALVWWCIMRLHHTGCSACQLCSTRFKHASAALWHATGKVAHALIVLAVQPTSNFGIGSDNGQTVGRVSEAVKHPHLDTVLHPFQHRSG